MLPYYQGGNERLLDHSRGCQYEGHALLSLKHYSQYQGLGSACRFQCGSIVSNPPKMTRPIFNPLDFQPSPELPTSDQPAGFTKFVCGSSLLHCILIGLDSATLATTLTK